MMEASQQVVVIGFLSCCWTAMVMGSFALLFYKHLHDTLILPFTIASIGLPYVVMESLLRGEKTIIVTMIFVAALGAEDLAFLIYNLINSISNQDEFLPVQSNLWPFFLAMLFALVRVVLAAAITTCLAKIRSTEFEERFKLKEHKI